MARKDNHHKNGVDRTQKHKKKNHDSVPSTDRQESKKKVKNFHKEQLPNDNKQHDPLTETASQAPQLVDEEIKGQNHEASLRSENHVVGSLNSSVFSEGDPGDIAENLCQRETCDIPVENAAQLGSMLYVKSALSGLLSTLRSNSPTELMKLAYNGVLWKLKVSVASISKEVILWWERLRPLVSSVTKKMQKASNDVRLKIQEVYPIVFGWLMHFGSIILLFSLVWFDCTFRGINSFLHMGTSSFFSVVWCGIISAIMMIGTIKFLMILAVAALTAIFIGVTLGLLILALSATLFLWLYGSFWTTALIIFLGGLAFLLSHERIALFVLVTYAGYCAWGYAGWLGLLLAFNLSFISTDALIYFLKNNINQHSGPDGRTESAHTSFENEPGFSGNRGPGVASTSGTESELTSDDEVVRLLNCSDHYSVMGFVRYENVDVSSLKREYKKKAMLVHPDKNMGNEKAAEAFKKLQNAYEILLDSVKRKSYDDELRRAELLDYFRRFQSASQKKGEHGSFGPRNANPEADSDDPFRDTRQIACKKCGNLHKWVQTKKAKSRARWCQDCKDFHQAKDGDGWVEQSSQPIFFGLFQKVDTPSAYVCADGKIYDATEWCICQGMRCPANTHKPSFHVNSNVTSRNHSSGKGTSSGQKGGRMPNANVGDATMTEEEFFEWLQNAAQAGIFDGFGESQSSRSGNDTGSYSGGGSSSGKRKKKGKKHR